MSNRWFWAKWISADCRSAVPGRCDEPAQSQEDRDAHEQKGERIQVADEPQHRFEKRLRTEREPYILANLTPGNSAKDRPGQNRKAEDERDHHEHHAGQEIVEA